MRLLILSSLFVILHLSMSNIMAQTVYRITPDGRYQYIENDGKTFDEIGGIYYKDITIRTFYLET